MPPATRMVYAASPAAVGQLLRDAHRLGQLRPQSRAAALMRLLRRPDVRRALPGFAGLPPRRYHVIVDVGANDGEWAAAARAVLPVERLLCFEPGSRAFARLTARLGGNDDVELRRAAVGAQSGEATFRLIANPATPAEDAAASLLPMLPATARAYGQPFQEIEHEQVAVVTLDGGVDAAAVDLLKIDVQGSELDVLRGGRAVLARTAVVLVEVEFMRLYDGAALFPELHAFLDGEGFGLYSLAIVGRSVDGTAADGDAVYIRRDG